MLNYISCFLSFFLSKISVSSILVSSILVSTIIFFPSYSFCSDFYLENLTFYSDINFEKEEFFYLTGLQEKTVVSDEYIKIAEDNLYKKGRFSKIEIVSKNTAKGKNFHFILTANWILKKLILRGVWFGKHNYLSLYKQDPGSVFDVVLHEKNIDSIKEFLQDKGYFNHFISDELIYNKKDKSIIVKIYIKKRAKFSIENINFNIIRDGTINNEQCFTKENEYFIGILKKKIGLKLFKKNYSKKLVYKFLAKIRSFFMKRGFVSCKVSFKRSILMKEDKLDLIFNVYLGMKQTLKFKGNKFFTDKQIRRELLGIDYPAWFFTPEIIAHELFEEYYKKGYWNAVIFYKKLDKNSFLFEIKENKPVFVDEIIIKDQDGNEDLELLVFFDDLIKNKIFDEKIVDDSIERIARFSLEHGFWNFNVIDKRFIKNKKGGNCKIVITIRKGKQRIYGGLNIKDFDYLKTDDVFSSYTDTDIEKDILTHFNFYSLQKQKLFLLKHFQKIGYWYVDVFPEFKEEPLVNDKVRVFVNWKIDPGHMVKFGKVLLKGNTSLSFKRILKELSFKEGEVWDRRKIDLTRKNLKKLDVFKKLWIEPDQSALSKRTGKIPIKVTLVDDDPVQATFRLGYFLTNKNFLFKRSSTFKAGGSFILKNPTNNVDKLSFNMDFNRFERKIDLNYKILSPFGITLKKSRLIGEFKIYSNKYINPVQVKQSCSAYEAVESGITLGLNNEYKKDYFWRFNFGNEWIRTSKVRGDINYREDYINKTLPYFFLSPSFIIEKIDNKLDIKRGSVSFFSLKFMIPEYTGKPTSKLMCEQSIFKPIYKNTLIAARLRLGYILKSKFNQVQPSQRFYLGGPYSIRGYEKDAISPYGINNLDGKTEYTIQGGNGMININLELRFPLYKSLRGVLFQDIGSLSQTGFAGFKGKWFPSTGFGFRYKTPIGPIRFDIGFKWKHLLPGDSSFSWYLTLGEVF